MSRSSPRQLVRLSDTPNVFSANDMRLFHHFLIAAHPSIPTEYEAVWVRDMPAMSHRVSSPPGACVRAQLKSASMAI
jgi:hypothetical protein